MLIVADTSPLNYLLLIQAVHVLPDLYGPIFIPPEVINELRDVRGPALVQTWATSPPAWLQVRAAHFIDTALPIDEGERAAIALARELNADRLLIDESDGRRIAAQLGIPIAGTLAVLRDAAIAGLINLESALDQLRKTTFRASPKLLRDVLEDYKNRG